MPAPGPPRVSETIEDVEIVVPDRLVGERVVLRRPLAADAAAYASAFREDRELGRLLGVEEDPTEADVVRQAESAGERARAGRSVQLAICTAQDGAFVGDVLLHSFAWTHLRCEIGFWVSPAARGRGVARDAVERTLDWTFGELGIERVEMATTTDNAPTQGLAAAVGFTREGVQPKRNLERGVRVDMVLYGLLAGDWARRRAAA